MDTPAQSRCPGCGLVLPCGHEDAPQRYHASAACWMKFMELSVDHLSAPDPGFIHQVALDSYGAQHAGGASRPITTAFSLVGLCMVLEQGCSGWQVQQAHRQLAARPVAWPALPAPPPRAWLTVHDVLAAPSGPPRDGLVLRWASSVWSAWTAQHDEVRQICRDRLKIPPRPVS